MTDTRSVRLPLSASQLGIWLAHQMDPTGYAFNAGEYLTIHGRIDPVLFEAAARQVAEEVEVNHPGFGRDSLLGSGDQTGDVAQLVQGLELHRWPALAGSVQSTVVVPIHPCCGGDVDFFHSMPRPTRFNQLGLVQAYQ
jgi:hypothetical protein